MGQIARLPMSTEAARTLYQIEKEKRAAREKAETDRTNATIDAVKAAIADEAPNEYNGKRRKK